MIKGLTDNPATLPRVRKISVGLPPGGGKNYPQKLDYFRLAEGKPFPPECIPEGENPQRPRALLCNLAPLGPEEILSAKMRAYGKTGLWCSGDNDLQAERRDQTGHFRQVDGGCLACKHRPDNHDGGWRPDKGQPVCKPNGRLFVILKGEGATEATMISTTSKWSIINSSGFIQRFSGLGPDLFTIPVELRVSMTAVSTPRGGGQRARTPLPILSLHTTDTVPRLMQRVDRWTEQRQLGTSAPAVRMIAGPGVSEASVDEEPADPHTYPQAVDVQPQDTYLAELEGIAVAASADIGGRLILFGDVVRWSTRRNPEQIKAALEDAIHRAGAFLPGEGPEIVDAEVIDD